MFTPLLIALAIDLYLANRAGWFDAKSKPSRNASLVRFA